MSTLSIKIKGKEWKIQFLTAHAFKKKHPDCGDAAAVTDGVRKQIDFIKHHFTTGIAYHELFHAFFCECATASSALDALQVEEQACELLEAHYMDLYSLVNDIVEYYIRNVA